MAGQVALQGHEPHQQNEQVVKQSVTTPRVPTRLLYVFQGAVLLLVCAPLLLLDLLLSLPLALLLWVSGAVEWGKALAAQRDPVLAKLLHKDDTGKNPFIAGLAAFGCVYTSLVAYGIHMILRLFVHLGRPKAVFVVYTSNYHLLRRFFCVGTGELIYRSGLSPGSMRPDKPWVYMMGIIHAGSDVGFGVYGALCPALSHVTPEHLQQLPAVAKASFPHAHSIALAGRLPGLMTSSGVPIRAPIVDGLSGTVFAMEATIRALLNNLPPERRAHPTVAILGGGGYIGARLVSVLATRPPGAATGGVLPAAARRSTGKGGSLLEPQSSFSLDVEPATAASDFKAGVMSVFSRSEQQQGEQGEQRPVGMSAVVTLRERPEQQQQQEPTTFRQIVALDTRYAGNRHLRSGVLYTAEATDLESADVVLVITRNGDDVNEYVRHAQPGQEWGDDTHPEIGHAVLQQLAARGVNVHKAMATRNPPTALLPPLPGWPVAGTPGCLLMALVSSATGRDWNGAGTGLAAGQTASSDLYWAFAEATKQLGFYAMLTRHRRSRVDKDAAKED